jgi:hypothetical protein
LSCSECTIAAALRAAESAFAALGTFAFVLFSRSEAAARAVREAGPLGWLARRCWSSGSGFGEAGLVLFQAGIHGSVELGSIGCDTGERCCRRLFLLGDLGQRAFDVELLLTRERERRELAGGGEAVDNIADAGARGEWREKDFHLLPGCCNGGLQIEGDENGERGALRLRAADVELAAMAGAEQLPVRAFQQVFSRHRHHTHSVPELSERAQHGGFRHFATKARA